MEAQVRLILLLAAVVGLVACNGGPYCQAYDRAYDVGERACFDTEVAPPSYIWPGGVYYPGLYECTPDAQWRFIDPPGDVWFTQELGYIYKFYFSCQESSCSDGQTACWTFNHNL